MKLWENNKLWIKNAKIWIVSSIWSIINRFKTLSGWSGYISYGVLYLPLQDPIMCHIIWSYAEFHIFPTSSTIKKFHYIQGKFKKIQRKNICFLNWLQRLHSWIQDRETTSSEDNLTRRQDNLKRQITANENNLTVRQTFRGNKLTRLAGQDLSLAQLSHSFFCRQLILHIEFCFPLKHIIWFWYTLYFSICYSRIEFILEAIQ